MSKAILVMDMPESCRECDLRVIGSNNFCTGAGCREIDQMKIVNEDKKPEWCPVREVPQKYEGWYLSDRARGYNACIDEIMKGV